ncbi:F-box domain-containing protein [Wuchereria bancrofti]|uniref:F-box domain-containing protein n=1 Tax=Wuchereria bancrofti TaxID=6293 RepID=J9EMA2_WUCBA|nr:F-box domain-containing protein [Wuchereria bancrofti]
MIFKNNKLLEYESQREVMYLFDDTVGSHISLPDGIVQSVFRYLSVHELKHVSLTCHALNNAICKYVLTDASRFECEVAEHEGVSHRTRSNSYAWGNLLKMCTIFWPARRRRNFMRHFYLKFYQNWDRQACSEFLDSVIRFTDLTRLLTVVMSDKVGKHYQLEMESESEQGFWLSVLLRTQKSVAEQGRLFMLLFGPVKYIHGEGNKIDLGRIDWYMLSETIFTRNQCIQIIKPLSSNLCCLVKTTELKSEFSWSDSEIFTLMEEITSAPQVWVFHNFASLLLLRPELIRIALYYRIIYGHCKEAAHMLHAMKTVYYRWGCGIVESLLTPLLEIFKLLSMVQRRHFLAEIVLTQSHLLDEYLRRFPFDRLQFLDELTASSAILPLLSILAADI